MPESGFCQNHVQAGQSHPCCEAGSQTNKAGSKPYVSTGMIMLPGQKQNLLLIKDHPEKNDHHFEKMLYTSACVLGSSKLCKTFKRLIGSLALQVQL